MMPIDRSAFKDDYVRGTSANADKLVKNYTRKTGKLDAAASDEAEALYAEKIQRAISKKSRQKGLNRITEADMNKGMEATGAAAYRNKTAAKVDKMMTNVEPYLDALDGLEGRLPPRTADRMANLMNRAGMVVETLGNLKDKLDESR